MLLPIDDALLVSDIQDDFSDSYPLLKLEFYEEQPAQKNSKAATHRISPDETLGAIRNTHESGKLEILSWFTTSRIERAFREKFGLNVHVYRKENGTWVQSSDRYSLAEQSARAQQTLTPPKKQRAVYYEYL